MRHQQSSDKQLGENSRDCKQAIIVHYNIENCAISELYLFRWFTTAGGFYTIDNINNNFPDNIAGKKISGKKPSKNLIYDSYSTLIKVV
jgi:hypothetical protein